MRERYISPITTGESMPSQRVTGAPPIVRPEREDNGYRPSHKVRNVLIGLSVGAMTVAGFAARQHHVENEKDISLPSITRDIQAIPDQIAKWLNLKNEVPLTFDNNAEKGIIGPSNTVSLPQEKIDQLFPNAFGKRIENGNSTVLNILDFITAEVRAKMEEQKNAGIIWPSMQVEIREDKGTIGMQYPLDLSKSSDPNAIVPFRKSFGGGLPIGNVPELEKSLQEQGFYNQFEFQNVPEGAIIRASLDGYLGISKTDGQGYSKGGAITFQSPDGIIYILSIYGAKGDPWNSDISVFTPILDVPEVASEQNNEFIPVKKGQPFFQTKADLNSFGFRIVESRRGQIGEPFDYNLPPVATNLEFFVDQNGKVILSSSSPVAPVPAVKN